MKNNKYLNKLLLVLALPIMMLGCEEDAAPSGDDGISFLTTVSSYYEEDGNETIEIPVESGSGVVFQYDGSATEGEDYEIVGFSNGILTLNMLNDAIAENDENIRIQIVSADGGVGKNNIHNVRIKNNDLGTLKIDLTWTPSNQDLDLLLFHLGEDDEWHNVKFSDPGHLTMEWTEPDGMYGLSYNYYGGNSDDVNFNVAFTPVEPTGLTLEGAQVPLLFSGHYTLANIDPENVQLEQFFVKNGTAFTDFTDIEIPEQGSRRAILSFKLQEAIKALKRNN